MAVIWDEIYSKGEIHDSPSRQVMALVPGLRLSGVRNVLDAGCGTGRHAKYLFENGFSASGIDISERAIALARENCGSVDYRVGELSRLPYADNSFDFILFNHSLEYGTPESVRQSVAEARRVLSDEGSIYVRVLSTESPLAKSLPSALNGFSHAAHCIKQGSPVHFFSRDSLIAAFDGFRIDSLAHVSHEPNHRIIDVPLEEWVMFAQKI